MSGTRESIKTTCCGLSVDTVSLPGLVQSGAVRERGVEQEGLWHLGSPTQRYACARLQLPLRPPASGFVLGKSRAVMPDAITSG